MMRDSSGISSAGEAVGVAAPVDPLVVVQNALGLILECGALHDVVADLGVRLHELELRVGQPSGLQQDVVRNPDLADVVEQTREPLLPDALGRYPQFPCDQRAQRRDGCGCRSPWRPPHEPARWPASKYVAARLRRRTEPRRAPGQASRPSSPGGTRRPQAGYV